MDGVSLLPAFKGQSIKRPNLLFFQYAKGSAIRDGQWKLVRNSPGWELYDLSSDRNEIDNVAAKGLSVNNRIDFRYWFRQDGVIPFSMKRVGNEVQ